ncbi:alpha-1,2-fucosyltransferase [candidate division KSB1 bacterium]|nr:alpha-1,2-fucosyltransferase [candidate division KSB1 bacterium]
MNQFALGRCLSLKNNCELKLDLSWFDAMKSDCTYRTFKLNRFKLNMQTASQEEINDIKGQKNRFDKLKRVKAKYLRFKNQTYVIEKKNNKFDSSILKLHPPVYLEGYWHTHRYFIEAYNCLKKDFTLKDILVAPSSRTLDKIRSVNSVSVHIRRGDYISNPSNLKRYGTVTLEYYQKCLEYISNQINDPHFFVFTDDFDWAKQYIKTDFPISWMDQKTPEKDCVDLWLMTNCMHHVIANSTYSWWGAWLASNPDKIVINPVKWNNTEKQYNRDRSPDHWLYF